jgi:hypothetical protein
MKRRWLFATRLGRVGAATTALLTIALLGSGPALADTNLSTSGAVGTHSLVDTGTAPGVTCRYDVELLKRLEVRPPRMRAVRGTQTVAWRFSVLRTKDPGDPSATTKKTYTSGWQTASATKTRNASFTSKSIGVTVPQDGQTWDVFYEYVVTVEMIWKQPNGSITGRSLHRVDHYRWAVGTRASNQGPCGSVAFD